MAKKEIVADWKQALVDQAKLVVTTEATAGVQYINFKHGRITIGDDEVPNSTLNCIVLGSMIEKSYYDQEYDADNIVPPACYAIAEFENQLVPADNVAEPINPKCAKCPKAEFGTALRGKGPACKTRRKLVLIPAVDTAADVATAELAYCKIPPTSVANWSKYTKGLASKGLAPWAVESVMKCAPHNKKMLEVTFAPSGKTYDDDMMAALYGRTAEANELAAQGYSYEVEEESDTNY